MPKGNIPQQYQRPLYQTPLPEQVPIPQQYQSDLYERLPKPGQKRLGLTRPTYLDLARQGRIRIVTIRKPNARRGINLIYMPSVMAFLEGLPNRTE
jgi:hypothetical protein